MAIKLLQLNIFKGIFLDEVIDFVRKEDFDILHFQEVSGGNVTLNNFEEKDCFKKIKEKLSLQGELAIAWNLFGDKPSYFGNATFYKNFIKPKNKEIIWLNRFSEIADEDLDVEEHPRCALSLLTEINGKDIYFINTHLAWSPTSEDEMHKVEQARILLKYIHGLKQPFVLSGDFNTSLNTQVTTMFSELGRNLTQENKITNTLNPNVHRGKHLFPKGLVVDYIITHPSLEAGNFRLVDKPDLSDHLGLAVEIAV